MKLERAQLVAILKKLAPALSQRDLVPVWACFCFAKDNVHAYDDTACLRFPAKLGITGGIRGDLLLPFLNGSRAKELDITQTGETITIKAGRPKLNTALIPESEFMFVAPKIEDATNINIDTAFLVALTKASLSMGRDASATWQYGCTIVPYPKGYVIYATDDKTVTRATAGKIAGEAGEPVLLPPRFVELLLAQSKDDTPVKMSIAEQWGEVKFASGLKLFTKTVTGADPTKYDDLLTHVNGKASKVAVELPDGFGRCLERAMLVTKFSKGAPLSRIYADGSKLRFETQSEAGDVKDSLNSAHPAIDVLVTPETITRGLPYADKLAVISECIRLTGKGYTFLACTSQPSSGQVEDVPAEESNEDADRGE